MTAARIDYVELPSATAHELTRAFYSKAFGWEFADYGPTYSATANGTADLGLQGDPSDGLSAPLPVVRVDGLEAVVGDGDIRVGACCGERVPVEIVGRARGEQAPRHIPLPQHRDASVL